MSARRESSLEGILLEALTHFDTKGWRPVTITWCAPSELISDESWWAAAYVKDGVNHIGISDELKRAPRYVLRYLVIHELLHFALPARGRCWHHRAFRVAERLAPKYSQACSWLWKKHRGLV